MSYPVNLRALPSGVLDVVFTPENVRGRTSMTPLSFPKSRSALWDGSPAGEELRLQLCAHRKPRLVLLEKALRLAQRHARHSNKPRLLCFFLGSVCVDEDEEGITLTLDRFDPGRDLAGASDRVPSALLPGDVLVPCWFSTQTETRSGGVVQSEAELHHCFKALQQYVSSRQTLDLSQLMKVRGQVLVSQQVDSSAFVLSWWSVCPSVSVDVESVRCVPIIPSALLRSLTSITRPSPAHAANHQRGFLTMDQTRKLLLLLESDPKASKLPLVGLWLSGVTHVSSPQVWAWCLRFLYSSTIQDRVLSESQHFLLVLFSSTHRAPQFFQCRGPGPGAQLDYQLWTASQCVTLFQVVLVEGRTLQCELGSEEGRPAEVFREAQASFNRAVPPAAGLSVSDQDSGVEDEDLSPRPSPSPHPPAQQARRVQPSVPELSLLIDSSFSSNHNGWQDPGPAHRPAAAAAAAAAADRKSVPLARPSSSAPGPAAPPHLHSTPISTLQPPSCSCSSYDCTSIFSSPGLLPAAFPYHHHYPAPTPSHHQTPPSSSSLHPGPPPSHHHHHTPPSSSSLHPGPPPSHHYTPPPPSTSSLHHAPPPSHHHHTPPPSSSLHPAPPPFHQHTPPPPPSNHLTTPSVPPSSVRSTPLSSYHHAPSPFLNYSAHISSSPPAPHPHHHTPPPHNCQSTSVPLSSHHHTPSPPHTSSSPPSAHLSAPPLPPAPWCVDSPAPPPSRPAADPVSPPGFSHPPCETQCCDQVGGVLPSDAYQLLLHQDRQLRLLQAQVQMLLEAQGNLQSSSRQADIRPPRSTASIAVGTGASLFWGDPVQSHVPHQEVQDLSPSPPYSSKSPSHTDLSVIGAVGGAKDSDITGQVAGRHSVGVLQSPVLGESVGVLQSPVLGESVGALQSSVLGESVSMLRPADAEQQSFYHNLKSQLTSRLQDSDCRQEVDEEDSRRRSLSEASRRKWSGAGDPVVSATVRRLQQLGVHVDHEDLSESDRRVHLTAESSSTLAGINPAAVLSRLSVSEATAGTLFPGGSVDLSLEANAIALRYLNDSQLSRLSLGGHAPQPGPTSNNSLLSPSNMSLATRKYMRRYGLIEEEEEDSEGEEEVQEALARQPLTEALNVKLLPQSQLIRDLQPKMQLLAAAVDKENCSSRRPSLLRASSPQTEGSVGNILDLSRLRQLPKLF